MGPALVDQIANRIAFNELENQIGEPRSSPKVVGTSDIVVVQTCSRLGLVAESLQCFRVGHLLARQNLEWPHGGPVWCPMHAKDTAHAAAADKFKQLVMTKLVARVKPICIQSGGARLPFLCSSDVAPWKSRSGRQGNCTTSRLAIQVLLAPAADVPRGRATVRILHRGSAVL